jgi:hypothetical protein
LGRVRRIGDVELPEPRLPVAKEEPVSRKGYGGDVGPAEDGVLSRLRGILDLDDLDPRFAIEGDEGVIGLGGDLAELAVEGNLA